MKELLIFALVAVAGYFGWQVYQKSDWIAPAQVDEMLSDSTRVFSSIIASERALSDSLSQVSDEALKRISEQQERIQTLTTLAGRVRVERDTVVIWEAVEIPAQDTTITFTQTFTDSLFVVTSEIRFRDGAFTNTLDLEQLRDLRIDITLTERQYQVITYVTSPDFELNEYRTIQVQPEIKRDNRWLWFAGGTVAGLVVFMLID